MNKIVRKAVALSRKNSEWFTSSKSPEQPKQEVKDEIRKKE
jgi:hypothetical protein